MAPARVGSHCHEAPLVSLDRNSRSKCRLRSGKSYRLNSAASPTPYLPSRQWLSVWKSHRELALTFRTRRGVPMRLQVSLVSGKTEVSWKRSPDTWQTSWILQTVDCRYSSASSEKGEGRGFLRFFGVFVFPGAFCAFFFAGAPGVLGGSGHPSMLPQIVTVLLSVLCEAPD